MENLNVCREGRKVIKEFGARPTSDYIDSFIHIYKQGILPQNTEKILKASQFLLVGITLI